MREYKLILLKAIGDISLQEDIEERIKTLRLETIGRLQKMLDYYAGLGYMDRLLNPIAEKKSEMIAKATSKTEIEKIIKLRCPHYNGNQFFAGDGIVKKGVENTIQSVSRLAQAGMRETDKEIIRIMLDTE